LYWLNDGSEDHQATWAFLDRRIGEVLKIGGSFGKTFGRLLELPERIVAAGRRRC
jgi:ubiquinone biosynthesis protein COQ9